MEQIIIAVEKFNAALPKDESYSSHYCNYLEVEEEMELLIENLVELFYEQGRSGIERWYDSSDINNYSFPNELTCLVKDVAIKQVWVEIRGAS